MFKESFIFPQRLYKILKPSSTLTVQEERDYHRLVPVHHSGQRETLVIDYSQGKTTTITNIYASILGHRQFDNVSRTLRLPLRPTGCVQMRQLLIETSSLKNIFVFYNPMKKTLAAQANRCWSFKCTREKFIQVKSILVSILHFSTLFFFLNYILNANTCIMCNMNVSLRNLKY